MEKLKIIKIENFNYTLLDKDNNEYKLRIEFNGLMPKLNDYIYMDKYLLKENILLSFGSLDSLYGKDLININDKEIISIMRGNKKIYLKRFYG